MVNVIKTNRQIALPAALSILMLLFCACVPQAEADKWGVER